MKKILLVLLLINFSASAQTLLEKSWVSDFSFGVSDAAIDDMGNIYFACSGSILFGDSTMSVVVKANSDLEVVWANWYRTLSRDDLGSIEVLSDGNILIGGSMRQPLVFDVGGSLIKINPDGAVIWQKLYNGAFDERIIHTSELPSGNIVSVIRYGVTGEPSSVVVTNSMGELLARYELFDGETGVQIEDVVKASDDTFYATGGIFDSEISRNVPFILAFNEIEALWFKKYDLGETSSAVSIAVNANSEVAIGGFRFDPESFSKSINGTVLKADANGEVLQAIRIYREGNGFGESTSGIGLKDDGSLLIGLNFLTDNGILPILAEIDHEGVLNWSSAVESGGGTDLSYLLTLEDGRLLTTGRNFIGQVRLNARASSGEAPCNEVPIDIDLQAFTPVVIDGPVEFDLIEAFSSELPIEVIPWPIVENEICSGVVSTNDSDEELTVKLYPNPASEDVILELPKDINLLEVFSIEGKKMMERTVTSGIDKIDIRALDSGTYLFKFSGKAGVMSQRFIKL